ncbi:MAG: DUF1697 domain-containing protein [Nesterenkonia sp.]|uniref:DUF1697 domain-containing protein n=1 Tax=Nesterenkonia marinintestina TaxID=2979865 RepID=UPI0021C18221|nr:DUF1697 domain-containing protein [Nesterenkonia sp. GX14115]MDO5492624.1 DUF1697 domain-containing protein [Nesterenkonia sp.]
MTVWCALLRGITPSNPAMRGERLRGVFVDLGFSDVATVLGSGNVVFRAEGTASAAEQEARIQAALHDQLGIGGGTVLRTREALSGLAARRPFGDREHGKATYLTVTFLKEPPAEMPDPLPVPESSAVELLGWDDEAGALLSVVDTTGTETLDHMRWLERHFGRDITTRTWNTVRRIVAKCPAD